MPIIKIFLSAPDQTFRVLEVGLRKVGAPISMIVTVIGRRRSDRDYNLLFVRLHTMKSSDL